MKDSYKPNQIYQTKTTAFQPNVLKTTEDGQPIIRIGLMEGYDKIDFKVEGKFRISKLDGKPILTNYSTNLKWRSKPEGEVLPAKFTYSVLAQVTTREDELPIIRKKYEDKGYQTSVQKIGGPITIGKKILGDNSRYRVLVGNFSNEQEAVKFMTELDTPTPRVVRIKQAGTIGRVEVYDSEAIISEVIENGFRIEPESKETSITLFGVKIGSGFQWEKEENRTYTGVIEIRFDNEGKLDAINELPLDDYIEGVLPSEMPSDFPIEALKAQAVAARSETISKIGLKHLNDPYHLCAHVHCQVYSGITKRVDSAIRAVAETKGEVLRYLDEIIDAAYSANSGGFSENRENVWAAPPVPYLKGKLHADAAYAKTFKLDLTKEEDVRKWINDKPPVYSNPAGFTQVPSLQKLAKNFRWEVTITRRELEEILQKKIGENIGTIYDIIPHIRGVSGRILEIEILGSLKNLKIKKELAIRRALSPTALQSSCFYVIVETDTAGVPTEFTFKGAGFGHGVGMCQTGAGVMALQNKKYQEILQQYYPGVEIERLPDWK
ncbi:MAG: SpoIID/LytB domain-containing protein [bacterium]|nr:SpoIID/LytB domain-containing protein [bacterium]